VRRHILTNGLTGQVDSKLFGYDGNTAGSPMSEKIVGMITASSAMIVTSITTTTTGAE
jgi:hypothetical protein